MTPLEPHPDHHLWKNGRLYWAAFTIHVEGWRIERIRCSLGTDDLIEARRRRDTLLADFAQKAGIALSLRPRATHGWPRRTRAVASGPEASLALEARS